MKQAAFFDVDGTLWDWRNYIPDSTREAMKRLKENGVLTFINTGRAKGYLRYPDLFTLDFDGIVASCGTHILMQGEELFQYFVEPEIMADTLTITEARKVRSILEGPEHLYMREKEFNMDLYGQKVIREMGEDLRDIDECYGKWRVNKLSCDMNWAEPKDQQECVDILSEKYYDPILHGHGIVEFVPRGFSKGSGIQKVCELLDIDIANTYAFGDSPNDETMFQVAGHAIVMGNGVDSMKEMAEYVTADLLDDGIYKACKHYGLI